MALFVAVTIVPVLCALVLKPPVPADQRARRRSAACTRGASASSTASTTATASCCTSRSPHRPTVLAVSALLVRRLDLRASRRSSYELMPQTDEGEVTVDTENCRSASRIERMEATIGAARRAHPPGRARSADAGDGGRRRASRARAAQHRGAITVILLRRAASASGRTTRSRRRCAATLAGIAGVIVRARPSGGNFQLQPHPRRRHRRPARARDPRLRPRRRPAAVERRASC